MEIMLKNQAMLSFDNPIVEQEYIETARLRRSLYLKYVVGLGIATLVIYFVLNPLILPTSGVNQFNYLAVPLLAVLTAYFFLLRTKMISLGHGSILSCLWASPLAWQR
ncbi:MAG: hypothetical protein IPP45_14350 [Sphingomonadales bacterium]|nr:hypothetical protein [Sphingomonadales bacterium]